MAFKSHLSDCQI